MPLVRQYWVISGDNSLAVKYTVSYYHINFQITSIVRWTLGLLYFHRTQLVSTTEVSWDTSAALPKCPDTSATLPMCLRDTSAMLPKCLAAEVSGNRNHDYTDMFIDT